MLVIVGFKCRCPRPNLQINLDAWRCPAFRGRLRVAGARLTSRTAPPAMIPHRLLPSSTPAPPPPPPPLIALHFSPVLHGFPQEVAELYRRQVVMCQREKRSSGKVSKHSARAQQHATAAIKLAAMSDHGVPIRSRVGLHVPRSCVVRIQVVAVRRCRGSVSGYAGRSPGCGAWARAVSATAVGAGERRAVWATESSGKDGSCPRPLPRRDGRARSGGCGGGGSWPRRWGLSRHRLGVAGAAAGRRWAGQGGALGYDRCGGAQRSPAVAGRRRRIPGVAGTQLLSSSPASHLTRLADGTPPRTHTRCAWVPWERVSHAPFRQIPHERPSTSTSGVMCHGSNHGI